MTLLNTTHQRKSALLTVIVLVVIALLIFNFGLQYLDPPKEYGVAISYGTTTKGKQTSTKLPAKKAVVTPTKNLKEAVVKQQEITKPQLLKNNIKTTEKIDAPSIATSKKEVLKKTEAPKKAVKKTKEVTPKPKPKKDIQDALNTLLNGSSDASKGDDNESGIKGNNNSKTVTNKYYGNTNGGQSGNYNLAGRAALEKPKNKPDCLEEGIVVVRVTVNRNGKVEQAVPGVKGSTNTAACLLKPAKAAALATTWNVDLKAPPKQVGTIIYRFSVSN